MTLPAAFLTAIAGRDFPGAVWIEIEGATQAFGNFSGSVSSNPAVTVQRWLKELPAIAPQVLDVARGRLDAGTMQARILDGDGTLAAYTASRRTDKVAYLATTLTTSTTGTVTLVGDITGWASSGYAWIGRECLSYDTLSGQTINVLARARYGTTASAHTASGLVDGATFLGEVAVPYNPVLIGRRIKLRWAIGTDGTVPITDTGAMTLFSGVINFCDWEDDCRVLVLDCSDVVLLTKQPLFRDLGLALQGRDRARQVTLAAEISADVTPATLVLDGAGDNQTRLGNTYWLVGDEVVATNGTAILYRQVLWEQRGHTTGRRPALPAGAPIRECLVISKTDASSSSPLQYSLFSAGDHPLQVLLQILCSTNGNDGNNGDYDTLTYSAVKSVQLGLGISASLIDVTAIEALVDGRPTLRFRTVALAPVTDGYSWLTENLLRPFGYYFKTSVDGLISVGELHDADPTDVSGARALTTSNVVSVGPMQIAVDEVVTAIEWRDSSVVKDGKLELAPPVILGVQGDLDTQLRYPGKDPIKVTCAGVHTAAWAGDAYVYNQFREIDWNSTVAGDLLRRLYTRCGAPPLRLALECRLSVADLEVGGLVALTYDNLPSLTSATRGLSGAVFEVVEKLIDLRAGLVRLVIMQSGLGNVAVRFLSPALDVTAWGDDQDVDGNASVGHGRLTVSPNGYTDATGTPEDTEPFVVNDVVRIYSSDLSSRSATATIVDIDDTDPSDTYVEIDKNQAALGLTPAAGYVVMLADFTEQLAASKLKYAALGSNAEVLSTGTSHVYGSA